MRVVSSSLLVANSTSRQPSQTDNIFARWIVGGPEIVQAASGGNEVFNSTAGSSGRGVRRTVVILH